MNREEWLIAAARELEPLFADAGYTVPANVRMSCGWPGGGSKRTRIGECWSAQSSADGTFEVFISPALADATDVLAVLAHELVHATVGLQAKHGKGFRDCATAIGLTGKMTATVAGPALLPKLAAIIAAIGGYPHAALSNASRPKQTTRLIKCECATCGYVIRTTAKWIERGTPLCPCNSEPMIAS